MFQVLTHSVADLKRWIRLSLLVLVIITDNCSLSLTKKNQKKVKKKEEKSIKLKKDVITKNIREIKVKNVI